jgi:hypothetical protein
LVEPRTGATHDGKTIKRQAFSSLRRFGIASAIGGLVAIAAVNVAMAAPLPPTTYELDVDVRNPNLTPNDIFSCSGGFLGSGGCSGNPALQPNVGTSQSAGSSAYRAIANTSLANPASGPLTISASASGTGGTRADASGEVDYYLKLTGPATFIDGTTPVRLDIAAHAAVTLSSPFDGPNGDFHAGASASAGIQIWKPVGLNPFSPDGIAYRQVLASFSVFSPTEDIPTSVDARAGLDCLSNQACVTSADLNQKGMLFELQPDLQYLIAVFAMAGTRDDDGASSQSADAWVDPHFFLDPGANPLDQLLLSPNANNNSLGDVGAVPEPSTWAMMLVGFAGLGFLGSRQRRRMIAA